MDPRTRALLGVNIDDMIAALGWQGRPALRALTAALVRGPALRLAREMTRFDDEVAQLGIRAAASALLEQFARRVDILGIPNIPLRGPVLLLSNHPGMTDTLALLSSIPRPDLLVLAAERPFLTALPAAARSLVLLPDRRERRFAVMRRAVDHLRAGGALLTFPAGEIEPDPRVLPGAVEALERWSASSISLLRLAPDSMVVPVIVSGVLERRAQRFPLVKLRRHRADRERMAAMLQVLVHELFPSAWRTRVSLEVLPAVSARDLLARGEGAHAALIARVAERLLLHERA